MFYIFLILLSFITLTTNNCINIDNNRTKSLLNLSFNKNCYDYTLEVEPNCCNYFIHENKCIQTYNECINYEDYIIDNLKDQCHSYNSTIYNINYSDNCHHFTLQLQPSCCSNMYDDDCLSLYSNCNNRHHILYNNTNCTIPTKYTNEFCSNYTTHIEPSCCSYFNDHCNQIYTWCMANHPNHTSIFDLFLKPKMGFTIGSNLLIIHDIKTIQECLTNCLTNTRCKSIDYISNLHYCYLNRHVLGDTFNNNIIYLNNNPSLESYYYEKILKMPYDHNYCNIEFPSYLRDGLCDTIGGYNTADCNYDGGDCCKETCSPDFMWLCGLRDYYCVDPHVIYPPTLNPTHKPTHNPTLNPTHNPTHYPTHNPTLNPTLNPTHYPTHNPTHYPTLNPTRLPTFSPTLYPTLDPTRLPTKIVNIITERSETEGDDRVETLLVVLLIIVGIIVSSGIFVYFKHSYNSNKVNISSIGGTTHHMTNPVYDKDAIGNQQGYDSDYIYQDPSVDTDVYQDPSVDTESYDEESYMS